MKKVNNIALDLRMWGEEEFLGATCLTPSLLNLIESKGFVSVSYDSSEDVYSSSSNEDYINNEDAMFI